MNLSETLIEFAWIAHAARHRWKAAGNDKLAEYFEGKRYAYLFAAKTAKDSEKRP